MLNSISATENITYRPSTQGNTSAPPGAKTCPNPNPKNPKPCHRGDRGLRNSWECCVHLCQPRGPKGPHHTELLPCQSRRKSFSLLSSAVELAAKSLMPLLELMEILHSFLGAPAGAQSPEICCVRSRDRGKGREGGQKLKEKQKPLPECHQHPPIQLLTLGEYSSFDCSSVLFCLPWGLLGQIIETGQFTSLSFLDRFTFSLFCTNNMLQFGDCKGCREILISSQ